MTKKRRAPAATHAHVKRLKRMSDRELKKLRKDIEEFHKAAHEFMKSMVDFAALHPRGIKSVEKHITKASHDLDRLRRHLR